MFAEKIENITTIINYNQIRLSFEISTALAGRI